MKTNPNITRIKAIAHALQQLNREVVFVGGATVALYVYWSERGFRVNIFPKLQ